MRRELLTQGLAELGIQDPNHRLGVDLSCYAREAIARGLATFQAKQDQGTVPPGADPGRYLAGIIRNLDTRMEQELMGAHLLKQRLRLRDLTLEPLNQAAAGLRAEIPVADLPQAFVDRALGSKWAVDFTFWTQAAGQALDTLPPGARQAQYIPLVRRIAASFGVDRERRADLIDRLAASVAA